MTRKRRMFGPAFKAKVDLAAVRGDKTTALRPKEWWDEQVTKYLNLWRIIK